MAITRTRLILTGSAIALVVAGMSLWPAVATRNQAPFREVLTHGWVLDEEGEKLSKSKGTMLKSEDVVGTLGADVFRLWLTSVNYYEDIRVSLKIIAHSADHGGDSAQPGGRHGLVGALAARNLQQLASRHGLAGTRQSLDARNQVHVDRSHDDQVRSRRRHDLSDSVISEERV